MRSMRGGGILPAPNPHKTMNKPDYFCIMLEKYI